MAEVDKMIFKNAPEISQIQFAFGTKIDINDDLEKKERKASAASNRMSCECKCNMIIQSKHLNRKN